MKKSSSLTRLTLTGSVCISALISGICVVPAAAQQASSTTTPQSSGDADAIGEIMVTARRQAETVVTVPESITAFGEASLSKLNIQSFTDYATKVPNLSFTYGGSALGFGASRTIAIRGISGGGTTAFYIDDTPVPASLDPQVVDIQRIEVLKGPRGTLFGEGSLGGNVRMVTNRPSLKGSELRVVAEGGVTRGGGSADYAATAVANFVPVDGIVAARLVGFLNHDAGFITRTFPGTGGARTSVDDQGARLSYGGSASVLVKASENLTFNARIMGQHTKLDGLPVAYAPLPAFRPASLVQNRASNIAESSKEDWFLPSLEVALDVPDVVTVTSSTSYFFRKSSDVEDGTEGTASILGFYGVPASLSANGHVWTTSRKEKRWNQEIRASFQGNDWISGVVGARYADNSIGAPIGPFFIAGLAASGSYPTDLGWRSYNTNSTRDFSIFGEAYLRAGGFELTLGLRQFWLKQNASQSADGLFNGGLVESYGLRSNSQGLNPKAALSYRFDDKGEIYVSASKGFRAGGPNARPGDICSAGISQLGVTADSLASTQPDTVWNYEVGAKARIRRMTLTGAAFQMDWENIQQTLTIPICFITLTANAGAARVRGLELELTGEVLPGFDVRLGLGYNDAKITKAGLSGQAVGSRVFQTPEVTLTAAGTYTHSFSGDKEGFLSADYSYTGDSLSGTTRFSGGVPVRPAYSVVNARIGVRRGTAELSVYVRNLADVRANLGDINPVSYVRLDATGTPIPRIAILTPRQVGLQVKYGF
ncbi:TonB-dependent receptor [Novosphingobium flavum]|uniref:TonB-dependent receptor n=1 Tax=Novosphingobium aerophilum TaxID=2839843 RepID=A0A7X1F982_9SPHN|nr:TonB-dependent receptor [Novosphingobium aerophilum]MBC2652780.1 TonB-dependent receptor [Novosphingobium aerophilum]MBC2660829.1 TonB-dependent receptor [Novosphingobium aerophilum]